MTDLKTDNLEQISNAIVEIHTLRELFFNKMHDYLAIMTEDNLERVGARRFCPLAELARPPLHCAMSHSDTDRSVPTLWVWCLAGVYQRWAVRGDAGVVQGL